jgi:hypothetical protein
MRDIRVVAACHVHSLWSYDGSWSLEALAAEFGRRGYRILMMTEHDLGFTESRRIQHREACAQASSDKILVLPGIEYSDASNTVHVLVWGQVPFLGRGVPTSIVLDAVRSANGVAVLAHPSRRNAWRCFDQAWADRLLGIELWNRKTDGWAPSQRAPALLKAAGAIAFVGMDFHDRRQLFPLSMALDVETSVTSFTEESVLDCLRLRRCYACAFGIPLNQSLLRKASPVLSTAERSRQILAWIYRKLGVLRAR